ncbi:hypothetical protein CL656_02000 [bacterium]|nr:hypothetical protein [bacterium]|tara:strand:+ start:8027 stop:9046 length:1020 start_codon:yes stop_codon:yes gene_type:complete
MNKKLAIIFNIGSSSIKTEIFEVDSIKSIYFKNTQSSNIKSDLDKEIDEILKKYKLEEFIITGHRVVHGGPNLEECHEINSKIIKEIQRNIPKAKIHNPVNLIGIESAQKRFKHCIHYACFDTGFFKKIPEKIKTLAIPKEWRDKYEFQKYGFHGLDHQYFTEKFKNLNKLVICHLGNGCSISLIENQKAKDITMSYSPISGLIMSTRCGDLDANIICELYKNKEKNISEKLNFQSGLLALTQETSSMKDIFKEKKIKENYLLAYESFIYETSKKIASFIGQSPITEKIIFSGGICENNPQVVKDLLKNLNKECYNDHEILTSNENLQILKNIININVS